ncbi:unnamed protein product [Rotaria sordida]|uniref:Protein phosphatase 1 regulatory subunit 37-like n=2 Tax=Rotaria sordida TaxID=392033 RepID=A0A818X4B7_9BILA|nr:unnamed protein product [Rotaria sordida]CAF3734830.1 unnamed protein product [Rotaria sordida]
MSSQNEDDTILSNEDNPITTVSHKRRVRFPSDESQLRMISVAPEPLSNQPLYSLGVILQRYRGACQRLQIRPLNCLLDQLSTLDDNRKSFNDRLSCLKITNEKLDIKHIDAIEEILSRCRFHTLDFESSFTDDLTLVQLFDVIEYYESCIHLNLSNNRSINVQGYQALTRYLRKTHYLERLDMNSMRFDDISMLGFGRALRLSTTLYELHLESCQLNGKILQKCIQSLRLCSCLRELYLCDNRLQVQDSLLINDLIRSCGQYLYVLDLRLNSLQDNGMSHIASQLSQYDEHHTHQNSIHKISFQSNQLTSQGVGFLAKSLLHNRTIRSLNLSHNPITNEGLFLLRDTLLTNRTINELILRNCRLTDQAAIALAEYIAESSTIQYIDLRENNIQVSGICGMAIAMKNNKSLLKLDFDQIISTSTNSNLQPNNNNNNNNSNNIDRSTTNTSSLLSLSNLRRMTIGFGNSTNNISNNSNGTSNPTTRELFEQKLKWMNDIECICQRNLLLYEDQLRRQQEEEEKQQQQQQNGQIIDNDEKNITNGIDQQESSITTSNDILLEENITDESPSNENIPSLSTDNEHSTFCIQDNSEDNTHISTDEILQSNDTSVNNNDIVIELINTHSHNDNEVAQVTDSPIESQTNGDNQEELQTNNIDENSTLTNSLSTPIHNENDPNNNDDDSDKPKIHHSDSLHLLRKKVQHEDNNTSDDESELSSSMEQQQRTDGV